MEQKPDLGKIYELEGKERRIDESNSKNMGCVLFLVFTCLGIAISFTGIGIFIGLPLIVMGIISPFMAKKTDSTVYRIVCPTCGFETRNQKKPGITCKACKKRMVLQGDHYVNVD
ncbi:hypothetical protein MH117_09615 [Paenibacillus sp. ACRRX]|uniref:hypothetical protein n=1 Tax=Paenibacillus sp. ACRRX TaxID=2918206 RepID=UPI001EF53B8D|nr:hypothetical protein [Paenibacillus sp. ACRRX]MCG7407680.1 hypothetical protein [Paenibacillus sp. ACRRX]